LRKFLIDEEVLSDILTVEYFFHSMWWSFWKFVYFVLASSKSKSEERNFE
jgi:hypothetical protein